MSPQLDVDWEDPVAADLRALGRPLPTGLSAYESTDPVESGAPDLPPDVVVDASLDAPVVPPAGNEFVCTSCFLVQHQSRRVGPGDRCRDCT